MLSDPTTRYLLWRILIWDNGLFYVLSFKNMINKLKNVIAYGCSSCWIDAPVEGYRQVGNVQVTWPSLHLRYININIRQDFNLLSKICYVKEGPVYRQHAENMFCLSQKSIRVWMRSWWKEYWRVLYSVFEEVSNNYYFSHLHVFSPYHRENGNCNCSSEKHLQNPNTSWGPYLNLKLCFFVNNFVFYLMTHFLFNKLYFCTTYAVRPQWWANTLT